MCWDGRLRKISVPHVETEEEIAAKEEEEQQRQCRPRRTLRKTRTRRANVVKAAQHTAMVPPATGHKGAAGGDRMDPQEVVARMKEKAIRSRLQRHAEREEHETFKHEREAVLKIQPILRGWLARIRERRLVVPPFEFSRNGVMYRHRGRRRSITSPVSSPMQGVAGAGSCLPKGRVGLTHTKQYAIMTRPPRVPPKHPRKPPKQGPPDEMLTGEGLALPLHLHRAHQQDRARLYLQDLFAAGDMEHQQLFRLLDQDGDGLLSSWDLFDYLVHHGVLHSPQVVRSVLRSVDGNGDGLIDERDFCQAMEQLRPTQDSQ